jgi:hypothetical protein
MSTSKKDCISLLLLSLEDHETTMCSSPKRRDGRSQELKHINQEFLLKRTDCIERDMPGTPFFYVLDEHFKLSESLLVQSKTKKD